MPTILMTGCTGFVGSALAAVHLAAGYRILSLSRNDALGKRTRTSVRDAAEGFGLAIDAAIEERLEVVEYDGESFCPALPSERLIDVVAAWHVAAEMSYAAQKSLDSYRTNVVATGELYRHLARHGQACQRFFYVSTAYTAGMEGGPIDEELHAGRPYENAYQLCKAMAEAALATLQCGHALPVTLFRPTIVIGHSVTGWARRNGFGFHMFIEALDRMGRLGVDRVQLALDGSVRPDLVPIDRLVREATALSERRAQGRALEIFHCAGGLGLTLEGVLSVIGRSAGVDVCFGEPVSATDRRVNRAIQMNRSFASTEWAFSTRRLDCVLGGARPPAPTCDELARMVDWYLDGAEASLAQPDLDAALPAG